MYFENMVDREDTERLGEIVTNLLITDLSESEYMRVLSSQRLYDILKLLGREGQKKIDREVATQVATKAGAKWMLLGNVLQVEPRTVITTQLVDVATGEVEASQRITGEMEEEIFSLVDKLTVEIKKDLSLPAVAQQEPDRPVADVTTHSPEAYRYYLEGVDYWNKYYFPEAEKSFRKALEFDSTFAMAYYRLAQVEDGAEEKELIAKAVEYSDKVNWKEKHYIESLEARISGNYAEAIKQLRKIVERYPEEKEAFVLLGYYLWALEELEEAVRSLTKAIELDSLYKLAYNQLAYAYDDIGDFDKSIWAINKYISLAPDEANPYDSRGDLYRYNGKLDQAIESYKKAEQIKPGFSLSSLGHSYLFKREYAKAESCYKKMASSSDKDTRSWGRSYLAFIPLYQGKFEEALRVLDDGIAADRMEEVEEASQEDKHILKATIYREKQDLESALKEVECAMEIAGKIRPDASLHWRPIYIGLLAENGEFEKAEEMAKALKKHIEEFGEKDPYLFSSYLKPSYWHTLGEIEFSKGNFEAAMANFEKAVGYYEDLEIARAYLAVGRLGEAVTLLEKILSRYDQGRISSVAVKGYYLLGLAYEKSGWSKKAIEQYEEFLEIWKDADPGIPEVEDAKERLEKLRAKS